MSAPLRPTAEGHRPPRSRHVALALGVAVVAALAVTLAVSEAPRQERGRSVRSAGRSTQGVDSLTLPGAILWDKAVADGTARDIDWGDRCDTTDGRLALPVSARPACFAPFDGDNGGATDTGVTGDAIKVVVYLPQPDDPVLAFVYSQIRNDDTTEDQWATYQAYAEMFSHYYETYGRRIELIRFDATGDISSSVAATADAETIANDIRPFMVLGGPNLTSAFADTLAANGIMCVQCTPSQPSSFYEERAPYVWDIQKYGEQNQQLVAEYLGKRLAGRPAAHAGGALAGSPRVFGYIHIEGSDASAELEEAFTSQLRDDYGVTFADIETYVSPIELPRTGRDLITRLKERGVTTVVFSGDPLAPQTLTKIATSQDYFPEWIVTGTVLVDTTAFARTYDPAQWRHAFGPSNLSARVAPSRAGAAFLHQWYFGRPPQADQTAPVILPLLQFLFGALQGVGPDLTHEHVQEVLFGSAVQRSTAVTSQVSYGDRGIFEDPDFSAIDDQTEVWWDPEARGPDELGRDGLGMYRYVDGGRHHLPGEWPETEPDVFRVEGSVTIYDQLPVGQELPTGYRPVR